MTNTNTTENTRVNYAISLCQDNTHALNNLERHLGAIAMDLETIAARIDAAHGWLDGSLRSEEGDAKTTADENANTAFRIYTDYLAAKDLQSKINHMRKIANQMAIYQNEAVARMNGILD